MKNSGNMNEVLLSKYLRDIAKDMEGGGDLFWANSLGSGSRYNNN